MQKLGYLMSLLNNNFNNKWLMKSFQILNQNLEMKGMAMVCLDPKTLGKTVKVKAWEEMVHMVIMEEEEEKIVKKEKN
jgi:hypothetical protein